MERYFVYMLRCKDGTYYVGITNDVERRLYEHHNGDTKTAYTYYRRPVELVHTSEFPNVDDALRWEKQLKGWRREKKLALIRGDYCALPRLAKTAKPAPPVSS